MTRQIALILLRHHKGIIAEVERLESATPEAQLILKGERDLVKKLEKSLARVPQSTVRDA